MTAIEITQKIDKRLMELIPDLLYEELKSIRKNESENIDEEIQEFLGKDLRDEYGNLSPLIYNLNKILNNLYKEYNLSVPHERHNFKIHKAFCK